ncbi:MAG: ATP-binding cassette domain-containing protein [Thermoprotei archaeon]
MDQPILVVENVTKRFGGIAALKGVSFEVKRGEFMGVIGPNGAGKTTLFNVVSGWIKPDSGKVVFNAQEITGRRPSAVVRLGLVRTFQLVKPFLNLSALDNVVLAALSATGREHGKLQPEDMALNALRSVGLEDRAHIAASQLTHGELKRLGVAQGLVLNPTLLLLDEPFGGLSGEEISVVSKVLLERSSRGLSFVVIEHRVRELMRLVNRVVALDQGSVIKVGTPEEVVDDDRVLEAFLGRGTGVAGSKGN